MSIMNKKTKSPVEKYIKYNATKAEFSYWDKEQEKDIVITDPITFLNVNEYSTIIGWSDANQSQIYSNEVLSMKEKFNVKLSKGGPIAEGLYKDIKLEIRAAGGRFAQVSYAILNKEIVKFVWKGAALYAWGQRPQGEIISVADFTEETKGATKYFIPTFTASAITEEQEKEVRETYSALFTYLEGREHKEHVPFAGNNTQEEPIDVATLDSSATPATPPVTEAKPFVAQDIQDFNEAVDAKKDDTDMEETIASVPF